jgi:dTMP kinase
MAARSGRQPGKPTPRRVRDLLRGHEAKRGLLVAFEGPDGSGKTTQRKLFTRWLETQGQRVCVTKGGTSPLVKPLLDARRKAHALSPEELCLLQAADFRHRLEQEILPALWSGQVVIADRYLFTGLARDAARGLDLDWVLHAYSPLFWPDIVFNFTVSLDTSTSRVASARAPKFYDAGQDVTHLDDPIVSYRAFAARVMREYENLAVIFRFVNVDGEQPIYEQHKRIRRLFQEGRRAAWGEWNIEALTEWLEWAAEVPGVGRES